DVIGGLVVVKIIVIVLNEEHRRRTKIHAVNRGDLRVDRTFEYGLVIAAQHDARAIELACNLLGLRRCAVPLRCQRREQIPVNMIAIGYRRLRLKAQGASEQPVAYGRRQELHRFMAACAGKKQNSELYWPLVSCRECRKLPWLAEWPALVTNE